MSTRLDDRTSPGTVTADCQIVGTDGPDLLRSARKDVICGRAGNDAILSAEGADVLDGGPEETDSAVGPGTTFSSRATVADRIEGGPRTTVRLSIAALDQIRGVERVG
jgi:hypothetical protein